MRRLFFMLAIAGFAVPVVCARADEPLAHLHLRLTPCVDLPDGAVLHVAYDFYGLGNTHAYVRKAFDWTSRKGKTIDIDANLPAGFYQYGVVGIYNGNGTHTPPPLCNEPSYVGLLPGRTRTIAKEMDGGSVDLVPPLLLMGTLPAGYSASLVQYVDTMKCGDSTDGILTSAVDRFSVEDNAYYLYQMNGGKQFGLTVTSPTAQKVTFVLQGGYASSNLNGPPAYARYDISADFFKRALARTPPGNTVCIGAPSTSSG